MFDQSKEFIVKILSGGEKVCTVRYPTDEEWCARTRAQKAIRHILGRGRTEYEVHNAEEADAELFAKLRKDQDGPEFDSAEAAKVIERLERCQVLDAEREGDRFRIEMRVAGGRVVHALRIPTQKDVLEYGRASVRAVDSRRQQEIRLARGKPHNLCSKTGYIVLARCGAHKFDSAAGRAKDEWPQ